MLVERLLGDVKAFRNNPLDTVVAATQGRAVGSIRLGHRRLFLTADPSVARSILIDNSANWEKGVEVESMRPVFGDGLVTGQGEDWSTARQALNPAFKPRHVRDGLGVAADRLLREVAYLAANGESVDLHAFTGRATLITVTNALFGMTLSDRDLARLPAAVAKGHDWITQHATSIAPVPRAIPTPANRRLASVVACLRDAAARIYDAMPDNAMRRGLDRIAAEFGHAVARDHIVTLLVAGFETSASSATWMLYLIAERPALAARLRSVQAASGRTPQTMIQDPLTAAVIKETLRLYPAIWWFARRPVTCCELGGIRVPRHASVILVPWALHRDPALWTAAESFDPDRWLTGAVPEDRLAWMPFGAGERACIGRNLALAQLATLLTVCVEAFDMRALSGPAAQLAPYGGVSLGPPQDRTMALAFTARRPEPTISVLPAMRRCGAAQPHTGRQRQKAAPVHPRTTC